MDVMTMAGAFIVIGQTFTFAPFDPILQPLIDETLSEHGKDRYRKGTLLIPKVLIWLVLVLTLRRDLNGENVPLCTQDATHQSETRDLAEELKIVDVGLIGVPTG